MKPREQVFNGFVTFDVVFGYQRRDGVLDQFASFLFDRDIDRLPRLTLERRRQAHSPALLLAVGDVLQDVANDKARIAELSGCLQSADGFGCAATTINLFRRARLRRAPLNHPLQRAKAAAEDRAARRLERPTVA